MNDPLNLKLEQSYGWLDTATDKYEHFILPTIFEDYEG